VWLLAAFLVLGEAEAQQSGQPLLILDVPYISQSEALCGGAAAAMILRYWGARGVDAETFSHLVDRSASGIRTTALLDDLRARGLLAIAIEGSRDAVSRELDRGRPLLTLIEDRPGTFHYIVLVGSTPRAMVFHDPARSPFRTMSLEEFERRWSAASRWMAIVLPGGGDVEAPPPAVASASDSSCEGLIADGVRLAQARDLDAAERRLTSALSCGGSAPLRELAGVRLLQERWPEVSDLAAAAVAEDPHDDHAWRLLATSRFIQEDRLGALEAWNRVGEPRVDVIRVDGLVRTRQRSVERLLDVSRGDVLTPSGLTTARRRLRELPSASSSTLAFVPVPSGLAELRATVSDRPLMPNDRWSYAALGVLAIFKREIEISTGTFTGEGERLTLGWRYWPGRPRLSAALVAPAPWGGVWGLDGFIERQPFTDESIPPARRRGAHVTAATWMNSWARATLRGGVEQWEQQGTFGNINTGLRWLTPGERIEGRIDVTGWAGDPRFGTVEIGSSMRSSTERRGNLWLARSGLAAATVFTPRDIWFAGDTGRARGVPLRAHPLIDDGELKVERIGRRLWYSSGELQRWFANGPRVHAGAAVFLDAARVERRLDVSPRNDVDLGIGARLAVPGLTGVLRIDVAKGLRDGATAISFVYDP